MENKKLTVIGLGGVGGYFGFKICQANENNDDNRISFVARGDTYNIVKDKGLTLLSSEHATALTKPDEVLDSISDIENPDLILVCVKEYDLENVCYQLADVVTDKTVLLPMMNGADIYDRIRKILPTHTILPSCVYVASHIKEKGIVEHKGKPGKLIFGSDPQNPSADINWIVKLLADSKVEFSFSESVHTDIWTKFIFIASFGLVTAKYNSSIGAVCVDEKQKEEAVAIMQEIKRVADKKSIRLPDNIIQITFEKAATFPPQTPTSLQLDVNSGKQNNELELFAGAIIEFGKQLNIQTPNTERAYHEVKSLKALTH